MGHRHPMIKAQYVAVELRKAIKKRDKQFDPNRTIVPAIIVAVDGNTSPPGRPNMTWIDEYGVGSNYVPAWNPTGIVDADVPVLVAKSPKPPYERTILGVNLAMLNQGNQQNVDIRLLSLPRHARTHQWPEGNPGRDVVRIYQPALMPLRTAPSAGLTVSVYRLLYRQGFTTAEFGGQLVDLSSYVPTAGLVCAVFLYLDTATGLIGAAVGGAVVDNGVVPIPSPDIPDGAIPSSNVLLRGGQTSITEGDIEDRRNFLDEGGSDMPIPTQEGQVLFAVSAAEFTVELPLTGEYGWLVNDDGILMVVG